MLGFFIIIGILLPKKLLSYYLIICCCFIIINEFFLNKDIFSILCQKIGNYDSYYPLIKNKKYKYIVIFLIFLSIIFILCPKISFFNLLYNSIVKLNYYN